MEADMMNQNNTRKITLEMHIWRVSVFEPYDFGVTMLKITCKE